MVSIPEAFGLAVQHFQAGNVTGAERICRQLLEADADCASAWNFLGVIELGRKRYEAATYCVQSAIQLVPDWAEAHNNLGLILQEQRRLADAARCYSRALELDNQFAEAHHNLALTIHEQGRPSDAIEHYRRALAVDPQYVHAYVNLANALRLVGRLDDAIAHYRAALALKPDFSEAVQNLGSTLQAQGAYAEALSCYQQAVRIAPQFAEAHQNLSQLQLLLGDFEAGWEEYEWRWRRGELSPPALSQPRWNGEPLGGKTVLLYAEQGLGDTLQFIRYAALVRRLAAKVVVRCPQSYIPLLSQCRGIDVLIGGDGPLPDFDFHIPLLSLPRVLQTTIHSIPAEVPYLFADSGLVEQWRVKLAAIRGFRVGINWQGAGEGDFRLRDMPLPALAKLAEISDVKLISLQKGEARRQWLSGERLPIVDLGEQVDEQSGTFMDTAAILNSLDLVITSDTAVAHLAGALAVPVWVGLPLVPNWRWLLNRSDSPWYPTMRLFRQERMGEWDGVLRAMHAALGQVVARIGGDPRVAHVARFARDIK